jgi:hypothetical protein
MTTIFELDTGLFSIFFTYVYVDFQLVSAYTCGMAVPEAQFLAYSHVVAMLLTMGSMLILNCFVDDLSSMELLIGMPI